MDRFPQEIISAILSYFDSKTDRSEITKLATISRQWQFAVERINLHRIEVKSTELSRFANLFRPSQRHRQVLVKGVYFNVVLPSYSDEACREYEAENDKETNSQVFSEAIHGLFRILHGIGGDGIYLNLDAYSRMDSLWRPDSERKRVPYRYPPDLWGDRYRASFLQLRDPGQLPVLSNIATFSCQHQSRHIAPASLMAMAGKMSLEQGRFEFWDAYFLRMKTRRKNRSNLAQAVSACTQSMDNIFIEFPDPFRDSDEESDDGDEDEEEEEDSGPPNFLPPGSTVDLLNPALHKYIQQANVRKMVLKGHLTTPELFWPSPDTTTSIPLPFWQNLREMHVFARMSAPDGGRYLIVDCGTSSDDAEPSDDNDENSDDDEDNNNDDDDEDSDDSEESDDYYGGGGCECDSSDEELEYIPNRERMNPLLIAMARAAHHAPSLQKMRLGVYEQGLIKRYFEVWYIAKGVPSRTGQDPADKARVMWYVGDWRPDEEVERHWRNAISSDGVMLYNIDD
ncbi:hypothetical protein FQN50_007671 [Emmonsiellopsis sp. PD_5]|nr:hypothetical protein FQN50_007671 [Emmonsiellopsis sp. PD_5]